MSFVIGMIVAIGSMLGGYAAMGGHLIVLWQPYDFIIIGGSALGTFIVANPVKVIKDTGKAAMAAILDKGPKTRNYLDVLGLLHAMMREIRSKQRGEVEAHIENPSESEIFKGYPTILADKDLTTFICDYVRLFIVGNARTHEIEALMDEELETVMHDKLKPYGALQAVADGLPALGIVAAVLGVVHAMGALDQSPEILGELIGAALVGTFAGVFMAYGVITPLAQKIKTLREKEGRIYVIVKQSILAFMNGAMPPVAVEYGRKTISSYERPSIDDVESETVNGGRHAA